MKEDLIEFKQQPGIHFLDGDLSEADGLMIAGLSGIIGNPERPFRRTELEFNAITQTLTDFRLGRCFLKGSVGDSLNLMLAGAAWNLRKWLRAVLLSLFRLLQIMLPVPVH